MRALASILILGALVAVAACSGRADVPATATAPTSAEVPVTVPRDPTPIAEDLDAARAAAQADGLPLIALVREPGEAAGIDAAWWFDDREAREALGGAHLVALPRSRAEFKDIHLGGSFLAALDAAGKPTVSCPMPGLRERLPAAITALCAGKAPGAEPDLLMPSLQTLLKAVRDGVQDPAAVTRGQTEFATLLARALLPEEAVQHGDDLAWLCRELGAPEQRHALAQRLIESGARGRAVASGLLDLADAAFAAGDADEAARSWAAAEHAAEGESPSLRAAARAMAALAVAPAGSARTAWEHRAVGDTVVLVPDLPTYVATIARWRADRFFPVLFQDDRYAPRFVAAFKPTHVVVAPSVGAGAVDADALRAALHASWSGSGGADDGALRARLRELRIVPEGVVVTQPEAGEAAGALALAAGRFEGLEFVASPVAADGKILGPPDHLDRAGADAFALAVDAALARWPGADDGAWRAITLAGAYPYRWRGPNLWGDTYCMDDLLGRGAGGIRFAVPGRLIGAAPRAAYQAMCSLFLQPSSALCFDTYDQNPRTEFGHHRLAPLPEAFEPRLRTALAAGEDIWQFRERVLPWNPWSALVITSSGWSMQWSVPGTGTAEDVPVGVPFIAHMTHSGTASEPYDDDTIAGRALWGGAYFWFGASAEPFLEAFQAASYSGRRIASGAALGAVWRERTGQFASFPWRLITIGDPLCCLRREPLRRAAQAEAIGGARELAADDAAAPWATRLREARWRGDHRAAQALMADTPDAAQLPPADLAIALEECLQAGDGARAQALWQEASAEARTDVDVRRYARIALGTLMDQARTRGDREALLALLEALLGTSPAANFVERWVGAAEVLAKRDGASPQLRAWLEAQAATAPESCRPVLASAATRIEFERLLALPGWTAEDRDASLASLVALARAGLPPDQLAERIDRIAVAAAKRLPGATADAILAAAGERAAEDGAGKLADAVKMLDQRRPFFRDWLLLGPFAHADHGAWEALEAAAGAVDPAAPVADGDAARSWQRPFSAGDFGFVDLVSQMDPHENVQAYALATVTAADETRAWLLLGSDDGITVWLDGKQVHRNPAMRGLAPDQDRVEITLAPGRHTLLLRIDQGGGGWGFCARFAADREGKQPLAGVTWGNPLDAEKAPTAPAEPP